MRIARFESDAGVVNGSLVSDDSARLIDGPLTGDFVVTDRVVPVRRLLAPIIPTDILCIGLNYRAHAAETGATPPANPILFIKSSNTLADPDQTVHLPRNSAEVDYEAELVVVIKRDCRQVSRDRAMDFVLGFTCGNDLSARDWQKRHDLNGGQFARGKSFDGFAPIGPWIVTPDQLADPGNLAIRCRVSGETLQSSRTSDLIFDVPTVIASLSETMTIRAGSIIFTGTPEGVGSARKPPRFLRPGDVTEVSIEGIGTLRNSFA
jgi:2-keto-4-pentenoate hydratase/2-oxohepta-3-ene-1,7-dioic acid hydratase in catechol pathway